jgi:hypothetical protein
MPSTATTSNIRRVPPWDVGRSVSIGLIADGYATRARPGAAFLRGPCDHAYGWLDTLRTVSLYAYRLPAALFSPIGTPEPHAFVTTQPVEPLGPAEPVGNLLRLHAEAGIQLRVLSNLWTFWDAVITSTLGFSGIRLRNARPRDTQ